MPPFYFHGNYSRYMRTITLFDRPNSQFDTLFFNTNTIISYAFSPAMNKSLYTTLITITVIHNMACLLHHCCHHWNMLLTTSLLCSHPLTGLHKRSASVGDCQWVQFFSQGVIQWHTFASYVLPCQMPFCPTASLLPSVTQQQNIMKYCQEHSASTVIAPPSASDIIGQHKRLGDIAFGAVQLML